MFCALCLGVCVGALSQQKEADEGDECRGYCSSTYPEHTYPNADAHMACARGCRMAQVEALIAWPLQPPPQECARGCLEAYPSHSDEAFACELGCNTSTIAALSPDPGPEANSSRGAMEESALDSLMGLFSVAFFLVVDDDMNTLQEQAKQLSSFSPSLVRSRIAIFSTEEGDGENVDWVSYSVNEIVFPLPNGDIFLDYDLSRPADSAKGANGNIYTFDDADIQYSNYCPWRHFRHSRAGRIFTAASIGIIVFSMLACLCMACGPSKEDRSHSRSTKVEKLKMEERPLIPLPNVKAPLDLSSEYGPPHPVVLPVRFSTTGSKTVEGILTVV